MRSQQSLLDEIRTIEARVRQVGSEPTELLEKLDTLYGKLHDVSLHEKLRAGAN